MYDTKWHDAHGAKTTSSAETIIDILLSCFDVDSALDVGCGDGRWLSVCRSRGVSTVAGVDGPWTDPKGLKIDSNYVTIHNLSEGFKLDRQFDLAMSLEVAEHIDPASSESFVDNLVRHSDVVLFGAAIPYQGGFRHINERKQSEWASLFNARGYASFDLFRSQLWNDESVHFWYKQNAIVYIKDSRLDLIEKVGRYVTENDVHSLPLDVVHPELYVLNASYKKIAFKPLARELPKQVFLKAVAIVLRRT